MGFKSSKNHPVENIIGPISEGVLTTNQADKLNIALSAFLSQIVPFSIEDAVRDASWVEAMQEELSQFRKLKVWELVDLREGKYPIGTRWVFRNKMDERGDQEQSSSGGSGFSLAGRY